MNSEILSLLNDTATYLKSVRNPNHEKIFRSSIISFILHGEYSKVDLRSTAIHANARRWQSYLDKGHKAGLFTPRFKQDFMAKRDSQFFSALSECKACWFFDKLGCKIKAEPAGRDLKRLDLLVIHKNQEYSVEVKSPYKKFKSESTACEDEIAKQIAQTLDRANKQFKRNSKNILFLSPHLPWQFWSSRFALLKSFYCTPNFQFIWDNKNHKQISPVECQYSPDGKFLKRQAEREPFFTRVGAVVCFEEGLDDGSALRENVLILPNDNALNKIPCDLWSDQVTLLLDHDVNESGQVIGLNLRWSDGVPTGHPFHTGGS